MSNLRLAIDIVANTDGFNSKMSGVEKTVSRLESTIKGTKLESIGGKLESIGGKLTSKITKPALAAGTALGGMVIAKGWSRMTQLDNARVKLEAIGNSAKDVEKITTNANKAVKGTAYGMDAAMTTAASAVAAGVKPGKQLEGYLTSIADSAAVAGTDMGTMGSIFNKVATQGKANNEVLQQMAEAGIPIYQYLADQMGVTADQIFDMASRGEIGLSDFQKAVETHIGGAAKEIGSKTITGAISNTVAALSRIGANLLGTADDSKSVAGKMLPLFNALNGALGVVEEKASAFGEKLATSAGPAIDKITDALNQFTESGGKIDGLAGKLGGIGAAAAVGIGPVISIAGKTVTAIGKITSAAGKAKAAVSKIGSASSSPAPTTSAPAVVKAPKSGGGAKEAGKAAGALSKVNGSATAIGSTFGMIGTKIGTAAKAVLSFAKAFALPIAIITALAAIFMYLWQTDENFKNTMISTGQEIVSAFAPVIETLMQIGQQLISSLAPAFTTIVSAVGQIIVALQPVFAAIAKVLAIVLPVAAKIISVIVTIVGYVMIIAAKIITVIATVVAGILSRVMPIVSFIATVISTIVTIISIIISKVASIVSAIISKVRSVATPIKTVFSNVKSIVSSIWEGIKNTVGRVVEAVVGKVRAAGAKIKSVWQAIKTAAANAWSGIANIITRVIDKIKGAVKKLKDIASGVMSGVKSAFDSGIGGLKSLWNGFARGVNKAINVINKIPKVNVGKLPTLAHGTDYWEGGFAVMNEGGRGEIVHLPNGAQVIPHDVSVKYAKEAARASGASTTEIDYNRLAEIMLSVGKQIEAGVSEGVSGMRIEINRREFGRAVREYA